jgi:hypothetical protein
MCCDKNKIARKNFFRAILFLFFGNIIIKKYCEKKIIFEIKNNF